MLKVLLVDDEKNITNLLRHFITDPELEIVADSQSSVEAVGLAERYRPDIVISDIRMPELNGLEMVSRIREICPDTDFIMISGYQDFEYAYTALQLGVSGYLLKPVRQSELTALLNRLIEKKTGRKTEAAAADTQRQEERNRKDTADRKMWLQRAIDRSEQKGFGAMEDGAALFPAAGSADSCIQAVMVKIDASPEKAMDAADISFYTEEVCDYIRKAMLNFCTDMETLTDGNKGYMLLIHHMDRQTWDAVERRCSIYIKEENFKYEGKLAATISIGSAQASLSLAALSFFHACQAMHGRMETGPGRILSYDNRNYWQGERLTGGEQTERLMQAVGALDRETARAEAVRIMENTKIQDGRYGFLFALAEQIMDQTEVKLSTLLSTKKAEEQKPVSCEQLLDNCYCREHVCRAVEKWVDRRIRETDELLHSSESRVIKAARAFVNENYSKPIGLNEAAAVVNLNPIYFSAVFKEQTGEKFTAYLQNVRMNRAKELLKETDLPVRKIAEAVGYLDEKYFSRLFLKSTGVKPAEYRKYYS